MNELADFSQEFSQRLMIHGLHKSGSWSSVMGITSVLMLSFYPKTTSLYPQS